MRKELEEKLEAWKKGSGVAIDARKFTPEEIQEFNKRVEECVAHTQRKTTPIW